MIKIEYIYAGLLLHNAKKPIDEAHLKKVLAASGVEVDEARTKALVAALSEINIDEAIKSAAVPMAAAPVAAATPAAEAKKEEKKEEKKEVASEEETAEGLGSLFG